jgi:4-amino-4-deoxy-L-arabinose transferase-like glycosyltransferase
VTVQQVAPFREDALSFLVWFYQKTGVKLGPWIAMLGAAVAIGVSLWRCDRSPAGFAAALAMVLIVFISLNKQAFANYYYFVIGALWCALAANAGACGTGADARAETG